MRTRVSVESVIINRRFRASAAVQRAGRLGEGGVPTQPATRDSCAVRGHGCTAAEGESREREHRDRDSDDSDSER